MQCKSHMSMAKPVGFISSSAKSCGRSHAAILGRQKGVPAHWRTRRWFCTIQDGGQRWRINSVLLCCTRTSRRKSKIWRDVHSHFKIEIQIGIGRRQNSNARLLERHYNDPLSLNLSAFAHLLLAAYYWSGDTTDWESTFSKESCGCFLSSRSPEWLSCCNAGTNTVEWMSMYDAVKGLSISWFYFESLSTFVTLDKTNQKTWVNVTNDFIN